MPDGGRGTSPPTLAEVDAALARKVLGLDDEALLWFTRAEILGQSLQPENLCHLMGVSEQTAHDIWARLAEKGFIDRV